MESFYVKNERILLGVCGEEINVLQAKEKEKKSGKGSGNHFLLYFLKLLLWLAILLQFLLKHSKLFYLITSFNY